MFNLYHAHLFKEFFINFMLICCLDRPVAPFCVMLTGLVGWRGRGSVSCPPCWTNWTTTRQSTCTTCVNCTTRSARGSSAVPRITCISSWPWTATFKNSSKERPLLCHTTSTCDLLPPRKTAPCHAVRISRPEWRPQSDNKVVLPVRCRIAMEMICEMTHWVVHFYVS